MTDFDTELNQFMGGLGRMESGGNYRALNGGSGASGKYQFLDSTWGGYGGYRRAMDAPPEVQDARARQLMTAYYSRFGSWAAVAQAWLGGPGSVGKNVTDRYTGITSNQYVANVLSYSGLGPGSGSADQLAKAAFMGYPSAQTAMGPLGTAPADVPPPSGPDLHDPGVQMQNLLSLLENPPTVEPGTQPTSTSAANPADQVEQRMASA